MIQAEEYDKGGEGVAYHDTTPGNRRGVGEIGRFAKNLTGGTSRVVRLHTLNPLFSTVVQYRRLQLLK